MVNLETLVYSPLFEDETPDLTGWSKETVDYIMDNQKKVYRLIRGIARGMSKKMLQVADVEDIFSEVLMYCYKYDDYNISKAIERSSTGVVVSLEGYVNKCIKYCVLRYMTQMYKVNKDTVRDSIIADDGNELTIFDTICADRDSDCYEELINDLESLCESCESIRYRYGADIYLIWYVRLITMEKVNGHQIYKDILEILGITKKDITDINIGSLDDELMIGFAKAVSVTGIEESIEIIEKYVYSSKKIREAVELYSQ